jgi:hypothetical protein
MLFATRVPLKGQATRKRGKSFGNDRLQSRLPALGLTIFSADKPFLGNENVPTLLRGTQLRRCVIVENGREQIAERWFVVEREDNLDEIIVRVLDGPFDSEQEAEREAARPVAIDAPELCSLPDNLDEIVAAKWTKKKGRQP